MSGQGDRAESAASAAPPADPLATIRQKIAALRGISVQADAALDELWDAVQSLNAAVASGRGKANRAEEIIARWTGGVVVDRYGAGHDVISATGHRLEVKFSKLNSPNRARSSRRWNWTNLLGGTMSQKDYDSLILVGERDERFPDSGPACDADLVVFAIPREDVLNHPERLRLSPAARGTIALSSDPANRHTREFIARYGVGQGELGRVKSRSGAR